MEEKKKADLCRSIVYYGGLFGLFFCAISFARNHLTTDIVAMFGVFAVVIFYFLYTNPWYQRFYMGGKNE